MHAALLAAAGALVVLIAGCRDGPATASNARVVIGTGGVGGVYRPLGQALAERLALGDPQRPYAAESTSGSLENIERVLAGDFALGFAIGTTVYEAYTGAIPVDGDEARLRIISPLYPNRTHVLVAAESDIEAVEQLRGRRVSIGSEGSGTEHVARQLLEAHGIGATDFTARKLDFAASVDALLNDALDAAILSVGVPAPVVVRALEGGVLRLVSLDAERVRSMADRYPYYSEGEIAAGAYPGQPQRVTSLLVLNWLVARDDLPGDVARGVLDLLNTERALLADVVGLEGEVNLRNLFAAPIPLHPGVRAWLAERPPFVDSDTARIPAAAGGADRRPGARPGSMAAPVR
jgi:uncharacterized protein